MKLSAWPVVLFLIYMMLGYILVYLFNVAIGGTYSWYNERHTEELYNN